MRKLFLALALLLPGLANAEVLTGVFQTEPGESGGFLHVQMGPCADNAAQTCGTILRAYRSDGSMNAEYEHLGKPIVWGMNAKSGGKWGGGKIWAPDDDKTYSSKMEMSGANLKVSGCVAFICRKMTWLPVPN